MFVASPVQFCNEVISFSSEILPESKPLFSKLYVIFSLQICGLLCVLFRMYLALQRLYAHGNVCGVEDSTYFSVRLLDFGTVRNTAVNFPVLHQAFSSK